MCFNRFVGNVAPCFAAYRAKGDTPQRAEPATLLWRGPPCRRRVRKVVLFAKGSRRSRGRPGTRVCASHAQQARLHDRLVRQLHRYRRPYPPEARKAMPRPGARVRRPRPPSGGSTQSAQREARSRVLRWRTPTKEGSRYDQQATDPQPAPLRPAETAPCQIPRRVGGHRSRNHSTGRRADAPQADIGLFLGHRKAGHVGLSKVTPGRCRDQ